MTTKPPVREPAVQANPALRAWAREVAARLNQEPDAATAVGNGATGNTVVITGQVRDRNGAAVPGRRPVLVWISTTSGGAPGGTQTVTVTGGTTLATLITNQAYLMLTDEDGKVTLSVVVTAPATRHVMVSPLGTAASAAINWTT